MRLKVCLLFLFFLWRGLATINADGITNISKTNKLLNKAEEALKAKDFSAAIESYEKAFKEYPDIPAQANFNLGHAYFQKKDFRNAQKNYLTAATRLTSPNLVSQAYQQIGTIFSEQKDYKQAIEWYKKSLKVQPDNQSARFNYELAYKLQKKKEEEEKKQNPEKNDNKQPQKDNKQSQPSQKEQDNNQKKPGDEKKPGEEKNDPKKGSPENKKKGKEEDPSKKEGEEKPGESTRSTDEKQKEGKEEKNDPEGKENSRKQNQETNMDDPESVRMDRKKLQEAGLTEEQARSLLQAMRQNEVKYLQQRRFKSKKGGNDRSKPKW